MPPSIPENPCPRACATIAESTAVSCLKYSPLKIETINLQKHFIVSMPVDFAMHAEVIVIVVNQFVMS